MHCLAPPSTTTKCDHKFAKAHSTSEWSCEHLDDKYCVRYHTDDGGKTGKTTIWSKTDCYYDRKADKLEFAKLVVPKLIAFDRIENILLLK